MKIGLNATCLNDRPSGAKQRFVGIYGALVRRLPNVEFVVYEPADCRVGDWFSGAPNVIARRTRLPSVGRFRKVALGIGYWLPILTRERFDIFECFHQPLVRAVSGRTMTTIHDVRQIRSDWGLFERTMYRMALRKTLSAVDRVITVSEAMRAEILAFDAKAAVSVVYNGLNANEFAAVPEDQLGAVRQKFALPDEFVLSVGHFERRKNYAKLIDAMARLCARGCPCSLVLVGNDSGERRLIEAAIATAKLSAQVTILSGLTDLEVRCIYRLSSLFVFPSSYEGFGLPVLEAMAAGVPMVLSDLPVFREITENKGIYFCHDESELIADAIEQVLGSDDLRARLIAYGSRRVQDFSFERLAAQIEALYLAQA